MMVWLRARVVRSVCVSGGAAIVIVAACGESVGDERSAGASVDGDSGTADGSGGTAAIEPTQRPVMGGSGGGQSPSYATCFAAGTRIATPDGSTAIERIQVGRQVLAYNHREQRIVAERVTALHVHEVESVGALELADGRVLHVTEEHPVYLTDEGRYERADHVLREDRLLTLARASSGAFMTVGALSFTAGALTGPATVYNITVADEHNYFAEGVLVHNKSGGVGPCVSTAETWEGVPFCPSASCTYIGGSSEHVALNAPAEAPAEPPHYGLPDGSPADAGPEEPLAIARALLCASEGGALPEVTHFAFDIELPDAFAQVALYAEQSACQGSEVGQVWFADDNFPEPGRWTTQCVQLPTNVLGRGLAVTNLGTGARLANLRAVASCDCALSLKHRTTCGLEDTLGYENASGCPCSGCP